jgi:hypothetical protein
VHDALDLPGLGERFDTVLDSALFHVFSDEDRARYARSLHGVVPPGGRYFMLRFSDRQPPGFGPRRVSQAEIEATFADGWRVDAIEPVTLEVTTDASGVRLARVPLPPLTAASAAAYRSRGRFLLLSKRGTEDSRGPGSPPVLFRQPPIAAASAANRGAT